MDSLFSQLESSVKPHLDGMVDAFNKNADGIKELTAQALSLKSALQNDLSNGLKDAIKNGTSFAGVFTKIGSALEDFVLQVGVINPLLNTLFGGARGTLPDAGGLTSANFAGDTGLVGSLLSGITGLFEGRAGGGPVKAGTPYMVGERGPELFVPQVAGRINNSASAAPVSIVMNISTPDASSFRASQAQISAQMLDAARRAQRIR